MKRVLFQSQINQLRKLSNYLAYSQKMDGTQVILGPTNEAKRAEAEQLIYKAMRLLQEIE